MRETVNDTKTRLPAGCIKHLKNKLVVSADQELGFILNKDITCSDQGLET